MGTFRTNITAVNPLDMNLATPPLEALVDTGSERTWLPRGVLNAIGGIDFTEENG